MDDRPRLFVSHHSSKADAARQVVDELERRGVACWVAPRDIPPGEPFDRSIREGISRVDAILVLFCDQADGSRHVKRELILADEGGKAIIPLRLARVLPDQLSYWFKDAQWIDWLDGRAEVFDRIARQVAALDERPDAGFLRPAGAPWHVWAIGTVLALWNGFGLAVTLWSSLATEHYARSMGVGAAGAANIEDRPWWALLILVLGTGGGLAAGVLCLLRRRWMLHAMIAALVGAVASSVYWYATAQTAASAFAFLSTLVGWALCVALILYARAMTRAGVLR